MAQCECLATCPFFNDKMSNMPAMAGMYKNRYCLGSSSACARHRVFETHGSAAVPADMYPNDLDAAQAILDSLS